MQKYDAIIVGAGASGLTCAAEATKTNKRIAIIDHNQTAGKKITISGGGKANFTNLNINADNYICNNPHFVKSALKRYSPWDIIKLLETYNINWHQREHGQLFCDINATHLLNALLNEAANTDFFLGRSIKCITNKNNKFSIETSKGFFECQKLVIATGGLSFSKIGASDFGHRIAKQFGHTIIEPLPALVPLLYNKNDYQYLTTLSGISIKAKISYKNISFLDQLLFTHQGLSGPVILQISSYWQANTCITIDLLPEINIQENLILSRTKSPKQQLHTKLRQFFPDKLAKLICDYLIKKNATLGSLSNNDIEIIDKAIHNIKITPKGTAGFNKAEVTIGGINCNEISSKTMESQITPNLFFIGEVLDVTGQLGGFNFHWAWASGTAAGKALFA